MSTRPSRSSSIPIPGRNPSTSSSRNIESAISIVPPRPRLASAQAIPHRPLGIPDNYRAPTATHGSRGAGASSISISPTRPTARSYSMTSSLHGRSASNWSSSFEPRVVRAGTEASRSADPVCLPSLGGSLVQSRRSVITGTRAPSSQLASTSQGPAPPPPAFPRPSYLDHSALRDLLQTDPATLIIPARKTELTATVVGPDHSYTTAMSPSTDSDDDSSVSPPPQKTRSVPILPEITKDRHFKLPTRWSNEERNPILSVSADGRELSYQGTSCNGEKDAASARTANHVPSACGIYYYEVDILSKEPKGHISVGFISHGVKYSRLPGWEPNSWGYHGDDGCSFAAERSGTPYGPTFGSGDVIGCGIDFTTYRAFFTKNGTLIGPVFENVGKDMEIFPSVGLQHANDAIRVNFGQDPFKYDIDYHVQQQRNVTWSKIMSTPIDAVVLEGRIPSNSDTKPLSEQQSKSAINKLILSYLVHHGYAKTARAFQKQQSNLATSTPPGSSDFDVEMEGPVPRESSSLDDIERNIECRTRIVNSVATGDVDVALEETKRHYPTVLETEEGLMSFKLRCRKFVELILATTEMKKKMRSSESSSSMEVGRGTLIEDRDWMDEDGMGMDVDDDAVPLVSPSSPTNGFGGSLLPAGGGRRAGSSGRDGAHWTAAGPLVAQYEAALHEAISYGQVLQDDYKGDIRPEVQHLFKQTFGIVAWEDPLQAGGTAAVVAGHEARVLLANELNQAILKSQGRPTNPGLETLYRHTASCVRELGLMSSGTAVFADMAKELLDT